MVINPPNSNTKNSITKKNPFKVGNVRSSRAFSFLQLFLYVYHVLRVLAEGVHEVLGLDLAGANPENIL